jgi:hypothetical protein
MRPCHLAYCRYVSMEDALRLLRARASEKARTSERKETSAKRQEGRDKCEETRETQISFVTETQDSLRPSLSVLKREDTTCGREAFIPILRLPTSIFSKKPLFDAHFLSATILPSSVQILLQFRADP